MEKSFTMKKGADTIYSSTHVLEKRETSKNALWKSLSISIMMLVGLTMNAQVTVTGDAAGTYADLGAAITALNAITGATLTQNTVVTVAAGNAQTAPVGGYVVNVTGTSTASLSFVGNGNTISTPVQTANGILDAAIMFIGSDFVTISGFTINASAGTVKVPASNDRTEWGIAFMAASATNGCWNNTVINNTIQMGAAYVNSRGVYFGCTHSPTNATTAQLATASSGTNSFNIVRQNIIDSASVGVMFLSSPNTAAIIETGNKVSLNTITLACHDAGTIGSATGTISSLYNLSNTTARLVGVEFRNGVTGFTVDSNTITAATPVFTNTTTVNAFYNFRGVSSSASTNPTGFIGAPNLYRGNTITYASVNNSTGGTTGIEAVVTPTTPMISNIAIRNTINLTYTSNGLTSTAQTQGMFGIDMGVAGQKTSRADSNIVTLTRTMNGNGTFGTSQMTGIAVGGISTSPLATTLDTSSASNNIVTIKQFATSTTINSSTQATNFIDIKQGNGFAIANDNILTTGNDSLNTTSTNNGIVLNSGFSQAVEVNRNIINVNSTMSPVSTFGTQFIGINNQFFASTALISFNINDNKIKFFGRKGFVGINCNDGTTTSVAMKNVLRNKIDADIQRINISVAPTSTGMSFSAGKGFNIQFDTIVRIKARSAVTGTTAGSTTITGITIGSPSIAGVSTVVCSNNIIDSLVTEIGGTTLAHTTRGISSTTGTGLSSTIENNRITNLIISPAAAVTGNGILNGISHSGAVPTTISKNRLTNLVNTSTGVTATNIGVLLSSTSGVQTTVNNIISDLAGCGNNPNGTIGMNFTGAATNNVYYNTVYMRNLSSIFSNYGATGIMIPNNTGAMDIKNNIIHLENAASNAGPLGTGTYAALRVGAAGTPGVPPTNLSATNNIYFTPAISNSFLYAEGLVAGTLASLTDTFTLSGDPAFNQSCGTYKTFMGAKDLGSVTANIPVTVTNGVVTPTSTPNLADNNALAIASVTTDFNNTTRGTFPDIGAVEFTSTAPIDQAGPVINFASLPNLACFNQQVLTATITDNSGINTTTAKPRLYYRKKTDATTFGANTSAGTGWKFVEPSNTTSPFTFTMDYSLLTAAPAVGDSIEYFVVAQDNVGTANVSGKTVALTPSNTCLTSVNLATVVGLTDALGGNTFTFLAQPTITFDVKKNPICSGLTDTVKGTLTQSGNINIGNTITTGTGTGQSIFAGGWGGTKSQYIIRASELTAQGLSGGPITAIGFTPTTSASTYEGVQLWIGHTALAAFANTTFIDTLAQTKVFEAPGALAAFTPTANTLNTFTFGTTGTPTLGSPVSSSFVWDGVSNIVLTFCHSENPTAGNVTASSMQFHVPGFICAITRQNDNQSMSAMLGATGSATNTNRPNFVISGNKAPVVSSAINPSSGYAWNTGATTQTFFPNPATVPTTTYKLTITDISGCQVNDSTNITVDPLPAAPTTTSISKCGLAPSTTTVVTDATTPAITGPIFKWYKTSTSTTVLQASTDAFYNGNSPAFGTDTFFISVTNPTTTCEGPRTMMVYTSTAPPDTIAPTINMMVDSAKICEGASVSLNVTQGPGTSFTSFTWFSDSTQAGANPSLTGAAQSVTPTNPGTYIYRVTASGGGCTVNKTVKVIVDKDFFAIAPTAIQSDTNLACIGTILNHKYGQGGAGAAPTYPASGATTTGDEEILRVTFGTIDNITSCPQPGLVGSQGTGVQVGTNGQINFTGSTVPVPLLVPGVSNNLTVQIGTCGGNFGNMTKAFFDWNQDGDFLDAGEEFLLTPVFINGPNTTAPFAITTPLNATFGKTRMRIVNVETTVATGVTSNTTYAFGETEDYEVQVGIPNLTYQWTSNKSGATILSDSSKLVQTLNDTLITYQLVTKSGACTDTATNTITGIPLPLAPTAVTINKCGIGVNTSNAVTDVSVPVISQPIFKWYAAATGGVALQSDTFRFWNSTTSIGTDSFFVSVANPLGGCEGPRTKVTYVTTAATDTILPKVNGIADSTAICEGSNLILSVTQGPGTSFTSFTWFSDSLNSGANPAIAGATNTVVPGSVGVYTYKVTASGGGCIVSKDVKVRVDKNFFAIAPTSFTSNPNPACVGTQITNSYAQGGAGVTPTYPASGATTTGDEEILRVTFGAIDNITTCPQPGLVGSQGTGVQVGTNGHINFTGSAVPIPLLVPGQSNNITVQVGTCGGNFNSMTKAFFDWNQDGDFVDPGEEFLLTPASINGPHTTTPFSITTPLNATFGVTRMRIVNVETTVATGVTSNTTFGFGETEDYSVRVGIPGITYQWTSSKTGATVLSDSSKLIIPLADTSVDYVLVTKSGACTDTAVNTVTDNVPALVSNPIVGPVDATSCDTVSLKGTSTGGCGPYTYAWTSANANFVTATNDSVVRFLLTGTSGAKTVKLVITDNLGAKDSFTQTITLTSPQLLTTTPDTICGTQTASLAATVNTGSDIKWYNSASINDTILATGSPFVTPLLSGTDTFFVEASADGALQFAARPTAPAASFASGSNNIGLKFKTTKPIVLDSVDVFAGTATSTSLTIGLFVEGSATPIKTTTVATTGGTKVLSSVELGWTITPGTYRILRTAASSSYHRETGMATSPYPMKLGSSGSIDSGVNSVTGAASALEYNLFYNWRIKEVCTTPRTAVIVNSVSAPALTLNKSMDSMCSGLVSDTVKLTSNVSDYNTYTWAPATGIAGAANAWVVNETTPGTYKYILTGTQTSSLGCVNKDTLDFIVKTIPAAFTIAPAGPLTLCNGTAQQLVAPSGTSTMTWSSNTGLFSNASATTAYAGTDRDTVWAAPTDTVKYFATATHPNGCTRKDSIVINVTDSVSFTTQAPVLTELCAGQALSLAPVASSTSPITYQWKKNNVNITNTTSSLSIPTTVVADGGLYTLEATTGTPCSAKLSDTMRVTVFPGLSITTQPNATGTLTICQGQPFTLTSAATGQATMQWRKIVSGTTSNYGVLNDQDTTIASSTLVDSGLYFVQYTLGGTCGTAVSDTVKVTIVPAAFVSTDPIGDTICAGQNVTFTATTQNASGFAWTKNGTTISAGGNITITNTGSTQSVLTISNATATDAGNYRLIALNVGSCVADTSAIATLGINAKPSIASTTLPAATICAGSTMSFAVTASNNSRVVWFGGATGTDSIQNATSFTLSATAGIYSVKVIGNSPCGDTTSASVTTTVTPLSTITKPVLTSNPICAGSTTTVSANFTNADSVVWFQGSTRLGLGTVAGSTSTFTVSTAGTYTARAYSANGCLNVDSTSATLAINPKPAISSTTLPAATVCAGSTMSFAVTASNNSRVVWFGGATGTDSIQNATSFTLPATAGVYSVKVIGNSPCGDTTSASVTTTVTPLASITTQPSATTVCQGSAMSFTIAASNADSIVWFRGATRVGTGTSYNVTSATSADSANYSAVAYSAAGCTNATSNVVLGAVKPQATITTQPVANTYVLTGTNASVSVSASNFDSVVWFKGATRISNGATLSITNFDSATHAGKYTARVYSQAPCTNFIVSDTANIIKSTCPVITTQPIGDTLCIGSTYALSVTAGAVNTYEWYKVGNATPIASTSSTTLNLNALTSGGRYFVKLTPLTGCTTTVTSDTVNVGVDDSTKITAQPTASTTICEGSALNLSVTATGSGTLSYQWMNGSTNVGTNSNSYSVSSAATTDAGTYKVMVSSTSACPSATSSNAVVNVTPAATITTQPSSSTICEGSTLSFTIAANNADSIVWFNGTTRVGTGATFSQTNAQTTNSGNYVAIAYRGAGCSNVSSNSVAGTVNAAPAITTQPTSSAFGCNGSNFNSLSVVASNATSYQWKQGSTNKGGTSATISISPFTVSDTGNYTVVVSGTAPCADVTSTIANVKITDTAKIVTQPASLTDVCVGGTLRLKVVGNGAASYQWYKGTTAISGETKDSLVIANVAAATAGTYKVEAIAFAGCVNTTSSNAVVTISTPVTFTTQPAASTICAGGTINLSTAVSGNSSPTYVWKKDGVALGAPSSTGFSKSSAMLSDSGNYTVEVTGAASCPTIVSNTAKVTINAAPTITAISGTSPLCVGSTLTLSATATNNNGVIWKKGTATVGTSSTYTKTAATIDAGSYTVTAVGKTGCADVTSAAFTQAITSPASITTQPVSTAVLTGSSFTLSVTASNANTYQWYKDGSSIAGETNASYTVSSFDSALHAGSYTVEITSNSPCTGTITSTAANVTKTTCPVITSQPLSDTLCAGSALNLSVTAVGASGYKWYRNGTPITGATSAIYSVSNATSANSGTYKVEVLPVTGATCPQILSSNVTVLVESTPVITAQPKGNSNCAPTTHTLRVATSTTGHSYQWFKNGVAVSGATLDSLNITSIIPVGDKYFVTMSGTGVCPSVSSDTVTVISRNPQTQVRLVTNSEQNLVEQCTENNWTYYAKAGVPNEFLLAIRKNGNDVMFAPDIEINPAGITTLQHTANNPNGAIFGRRFFNIDLISGTLQYPYDVKFYYAPADTLEVITKLAQLKAANASVTASRPSSSWITSTLVPFTSSLLSGVTSAPVGFANTIVSANSNGKDNQVDYVEITNLVAKNGGGTMFMDYTISSGSGISDKVNKGFGIEMYPVPATTELNVRLTSNTFKPVSFTITDMNGKVVMSSEERHQSNTSDHKFDISSFANGVYHIQLTNGETQSAAKFTVSK